MGFIEISFNEKLKSRERERKRAGNRFNYINILESIGVESGNKETSVFHTINFNYISLIIFVII